MNIKAAIILLVTSFLLSPLQSQINDTENLFVIEAISVEGNSKSGDYVVLENVPYSIGDTLSEYDIRTGVEYLKSLEIFSEVNLHPRAGSEPGKVQLIFRVEERYWPQFRFKGGFSELDGWYITPVSFNLDNILGMGNFTELGITIGDRTARIDFNYLNPNIFDSDFDLLFNISARSQQVLHYIDGEELIQNVGRGGYELGLRPRDNFYKHFKFSLVGYSSIPDSFATRGKEEIFDLPPEILKFSKEKQQTAGFLISFNMDQRDQPFYPTSGWWAGFRYFQADEQFGGKINFSRIIADLRGYYNPIAKVTLAARIKYGAVSSHAPFWEKFYLGGPNSLRGYDDRSLSPTGGGDRLYQAGVELRFPIGTRNYPKQLLTGVLFYDTGANLSISQKLTKDVLFQGMGFGLRLRIPYLGIIRMDMAYPVENGSKKIQFSLGHTF